MWKWLILITSALAVIATELYMSSIGMVPDRTMYLGPLGILLMIILGAKKEQIPGGKQEKWVWRIRLNIGLKMAIIGWIVFQLFFTFSNEDRMVVVRDGIAEEGTRWVNPFTADAAYYYPEKIQVDDIATLGDRILGARVVAKTTDYDAAMRFYEYYGSTQAVKDTLWQRAERALQLACKQNPLVDARTMVSFANNNLSPGMLPGIDQMLIVLPKDSIAFVR
jgi:hypothetical protein